ncbi:S-adenosyl-L-methionine-dependent methyltransferase [Xylariales sp. PMI_506]|nr:S-adenosyl-L-methionine-dependent methyltransferase [Xylariales sp. PMI_506]
MAEPNSTAPGISVKEKTFSSYNQEQGKKYAQVRRDYHPSVYSTVMTQHTSTGGELGTLLDVGCGPGQAIRFLAPHFARAIGIDPSAGMIETARSMPDVRTSTSEPLRFEISSAESLGSNLSPPIADGSVDLIVAANAAHWFDMAGFWPSAARVLKPGGSVALWCSGEIRVRPEMPNAAAIQALMDHHLYVDLEPYITPGNLLTRGRYADLPLPWTLDPPTPGFDESSFYRREWDVAAAEPFFTGSSTADIDTFSKMLASGSAQTRWRQANPQDVGTERDIIKNLTGGITRLLREAGVKEGEEMVQGVAYGAVLVVKKRK